MVGGCGVGDHWTTEVPCRIRIHYPSPCSITRNIIKMDCSKKSCKPCRALKRKNYNLHHGDPKKDTPLETANMAVAIDSDDDSAGDG